jgi:hypothetical protein
MDDLRLKAYLDACFLEYRSLRDEIQSTISDYFRFLQFGSTALLGLVGVGLNFWHTEDVLVRGLFGVVIPSLAFVCTELLIGHIARIKNVGRFCQSIEQKVQMAIGDLPSPLGSKLLPPLSWETWVAGSTASDDRRLTWMYAFGVELIVSISVASVMVYEFYSIVVKDGARALCDIPPILVAQPVLLAGPVLLEAAKVSFIIKQAVEMPRPYRLPLFPPIRHSDT